MHRLPLPPGMFLVLSFTRGWVDPRAMVQSEGETSLKNPVTPLGIDPRTVRLVAQRLNHYATPWASIIFPSNLLCGPFLQYVLPAWTYLDGRWNIPHRPYKHAHHTHFYQYGKHTEEQTNIGKCQRTNFREMVTLPTWPESQEATNDIHLLYNTFNRGSGLIPSQAWYPFTNTLKKAWLGHQRK